MKPALVVIDMQQHFLTGCAAIHPDLGRAVEIINHVAAAFRDAGLPVIWVQDAESLSPSDPGYALLDDLDAREGDLRISKVASNAFCEPGLPAALDARGVDFALLCGFTAESCVLATVRGAADRGLDHALLRGATVSAMSDAAAFVERISPIVSHEVAVLIARQAAAGRSAR